MKDVFKVSFVLKRCLDWDLGYVKRLNFVSIQKSINKPKMKKDFEDFSGKRRFRWNFRHQISAKFSDKPACWRTSTWKPSPGHPGLELFLSQLGKEISKGLLKQQQTFDLTLKKLTGQFIPLRALHQSYQFILLLNICKFDYSIFTLLIHFYFLAL